MTLGRLTGIDNSYRALDIYTRLGDPRGVATAANNIGGYHFYDGDWDAAITFYRTATQARERLGDPVGAAAQDINIAEVLLERGELDEAAALLDGALGAVRAVGDRWFTAFAMRLLGVLRTRTGDLEAAAGLLASAEAEFAAIGARVDVLDTRVSRCEHLVVTGRLAEAIAVLDGVAHDRAAAGLEAWLPAAHRWRGLALARLGDPEGAEREIAQGARAGPPRRLRARGRPRPGRRTAARGGDGAPGGRLVPGRARGDRRPSTTPAPLAGSSLRRVAQRNVNPGSASNST